MTEILTHQCRSRINFNVLPSLHLIEPSILSASSSALWSCWLWSPKLTTWKIWLDLLEDNVLKVHSTHSNCEVSESTHEQCRPVQASKTSALCINSRGQTLDLHFTSKCVLSPTLKELIFYKFQLAFIDTQHSCGSYIFKVMLNFVVVIILAIMWLGGPLVTDPVRHNSTKMQNSPNHQNRCNLEPRFRMSVPVWHSLCFD